MQKGCCLCKETYGQGETNMKEYCITYIATDDEFEEERYYYVETKTIDKALRRFRKHKRILKPKIILSIRLLEN